MRRYKQNRLRIDVEQINSIIDKLIASAQKEVIKRAKYGITEEYDKSTKVKINAIVKNKPVKLKMSVTYTLYSTNKKSVFIETDGTFYPAEDDPGGYASVMIGYHPSKYNAIDWAKVKKDFRHVLYHEIGHYEEFIRKGGRYRSGEEELVEIGAFIQEVIELPKEERRKMTFKGFSEIIRKISPQYFRSAIGESSTMKELYRQIKSERIKLR